NKQGRNTYRRASSDPPNGSSSWRHLQSLSAQASLCLNSGGEDLAHPALPTISNTPASSAPSWARTTLAKLDSHRHLKSAESHLVRPPDPSGGHRQSCLPGQAQIPKGMALLLLRERLPGTG